MRRGHLLAGVTEDENGVIAVVGSTAPDASTHDDVELPVLSRTAIDVDYALMLIRGGEADPVFADMSLLEDTVAQWEDDQARTSVEPATPEPESRTVDVNDPDWSYLDADTTNVQKLAQEIAYTRTQRRLGSWLEEKAPASTEAIAQQRERVTESARVQERLSLAIRSSGNMTEQLLGAPAIQRTSGVRATRSRRRTTRCRTRSAPARPSDEPHPAGYPAPLDQRRRIGACTWRRRFA